MKYYNELVDIPKKDIYKVVYSNRTVIFHLSNMTWDFVKKVRNQPKRVLIGLVSEEDPTKMKPNDNYFKIYGIENTIMDEAPTQFNDRRFIGAHLVIDSVFKRLKLDKLLSSAFDDVLSNRIYAMTQFFLHGNSISQQFNDYAYLYYCGITKNLSSPEVSNLYKAIDIDNIERFFRLWIKSLGITSKERTIIYLDSTNVTTTSKQIENKEYGKAKDYDGNPQINIASMVSKDKNLPLLFDVYRGSEIDNTTLSYLIEYARGFGLKNAYYVADRGYISNNNVKALSKYTFSLMSTARLKATITAITNNLEILNTYKYAIDEFPECYGKCYETNDFYNTKLRVFVFADTERRTLESKDLVAAIKREEEKLSKETYYKKWMREYLRYFDIEIEDTESKKKKILNITRKEDVIQQDLTKCGFFVVISNDNISSPSEILKIMRERNNIEMIYKQFKDSFNLDTVRIHDDKKFYSKAFIAHLASIIRTELIRILKPFFQLKQYSSDTLTTVMTCLDRIEIIPTAIGYRQHYKLTAKQIKILECFNISQDYICNFIKKLPS